jgi:PAS domain S-box-containing protein
VSQLAETNQHVKEALEIPADLAWKVEYSRALVSALPEASILVIDAREKVLLAEGKLLERHGVAASHLVGRSLDEILPASAGGMLIGRYREALAGRTVSFDHLTADGSAMCWIQVTPMYLGGEDPIAVTAVIQDVTKRHQLTAELETERDRRRMAEEMAGVGHWEIDFAADRIVLSEGSLRLLGMTQQPDLSLTELMLRHLESAEGDRVSEMLARVSERGEGECELDLRGEDGALRHVLVRGKRLDRADEPDVISGTAIDITALRAAERARGESEALFRQGFDGSPIGMSYTTPEGLRFLRVNDALCRLLKRTREELLTLSVPDVTHPADVDVCESGRLDMIAGRAGHFECEKRYVRPDGSSVWVSMHVVPVFGSAGEIRAYFSQVVDLTARKERETQLVQEAADLERLAQVRSALAAERLFLHAQPIVDVESGEVVQQELLVRLRDEDGRTIPPGEFLPVAERYGCITEIDQWVIGQAMKLAAGGDPVEVNLSAASVGDVETLSTIRAALEETGADPSLLVFEVTETAVIADVERGRAFAAALRELGCRFALDDFGTGYGTFTYLKHIPIDYLKIDIEFVRDVAESEADERLVRAIVTMARDLGKRTIAEGVENAATLERLRELGVDHAQGYHIGRPAPIELPPAPRGRPSGPQELLTTGS